MSADGHGVARRFSRAADDYDRLAAGQRHVAERLAVLLELLPPPGRILEIGCGTGQFTRLLHLRFPAAHIWGLDISAEMIRVAKASLPGATIAWLVADARHELPRGQFDLIAGSSSLHWMGPLDRLFASLRARLSPGGRLLFSLMRDGSFRELRESRLRAAPRKQPRGRLPTTPEVLGALDDAGFTLEVLENQTIVSRYRDGAAFLAAIHAQGVTGGEFSQGSAPLTRGELRALVADYDLHHATPGAGVAATSEIIHVLARGRA